MIERRHPGRHLWRWECTDNGDGTTDVAMTALMAITAIIIVQIVFATRSRAGVGRIRKAGLQRDEAQHRAVRL